ncbi:MAG: oligosaccharide flippase family protein [Anaerolineae bacterium]
MSVSQSPVRRRVSLNTALLLISNVGSAVLLFVLTALIGRAFGEEGLGIYALCMAWITPISLLVEFGIGTLLTRELVRAPTQTGSLVRAAAFTRLIFGGMGMLLLVVGAPFLAADPRIVVGLQISAPMVMLSPMFSLFTAVFRARDTMLPIPFLNIGMVAVQVMMTGLAIANGGGMLGVLLANIGSSAVQVAAAYVVYRRWQFTGDDRLAIMPLLRRAWPFALAALFAALQIRLSAILLQALTSTGEVGLFYAASRFIEAARVIPNAFFGALFPMLAALAADPLRLRRTFRRTMIGLGGFGFLCGLAFSVIAPVLLPLVFGARFDPAIPILQILSWSLAASLLRGGRTLYWYALEREAWVNTVNALTIAAQAILSLWLIPAYGAVGAAWIQLIVESGALLMLWIAPARSHAAGVLTRHEST